MFIGPTWGPPGSCRHQMGPMLAQWILLSGIRSLSSQVHGIIAPCWDEYFLQHDALIHTHADSNVCSTQATSHWYFIYSISNIYNHLDYYTLCSQTLKRKSRRFDENFVNGCTGSCHNDRFQCNQWRKFRQNDISVETFWKWHHLEYSNAVCTDSR